MFLDEPTSGFDPDQIREIRGLIRELGEKHTVLLSTHILPEVTLICQRVAIINHGRLLAIDSPDALQRASEQTNCVYLLATGPADAIRESILAIEGVSALDIKADAGRSELLSIECQVDARDGVEAAIARA